MMNRRVRAYLLPRAAGRAPIKQKRAAKCLIGAPAGARMRHHCARSAMFPATVRPGDVGAGTSERLECVVLLESADYWRCGGSI